MHRQRGSSIVEVVVMMLIMSISLIGIYTLVHSSQKLARIADERLIATNLAKESLESIGALRDTFLLRAYEVTGCFFTIDASNGNSAKCPQIDTDYILSDEKTLITTTPPSPVCINKDGWYSQESWADGIACPDAPKCNESKQYECQTAFSRTIRFESCDGGTAECIQAQATIQWWSSEEESLTLKQIFTRH